MGFLNLTFYSKEKRGVILILTLFLILLISSLVVHHSSLLDVEIGLLDSSKERLQALSIAHAGINLALKLLREDVDRECDWLGENWAEPQQINFSQGKVKVKIEDEEGKINPNFLKVRDRKERRERIEQMLELCDILNIGYTLVPSLIDWIDEDKEVCVLPFITGENSGAEDEYYSSLEEPYPCKNLPLELKEEILLVKGMKKEIWEGKENRKGFKDLVTVYGRGKVNLNTAPEEIIRATLQVYSREFIEEGLIRQIVEVRKEEPFRRVEDLSPYLPPSLIKKLKRSPLITFSSHYFSILSEARVGKINLALEAVVERNEERFKIKYWKVRG